jgi:hypothetical protein
VVDFIQISIDSSVKAEAAIGSALLGITNVAYNRTTAHYQNYNGYVGGWGN